MQKNGKQPNSNEFRVHLESGRSLLGSFEWNTMKFKGRTFKGRLVAQGYSQKYGVDDYDEVFSPIRTLLALAVKRGMMVHQMDVVTAFLNGSTCNNPLDMFRQEKCASSRNRCMGWNSPPHVAGTKSSASAWNRWVSKSWPHTRGKWKMILLPKRQSVWCIPNERYGRTAIPILLSWCELPPIGEHYFIVSTSYGLGWWTQQESQSMVGSLLHAHAVSRNSTQNPGGYFNTNTGPIQGHRRKTTRLCWRRLG